MTGGEGQILLSRRKTIIFYSAMEPERTPPNNRANLPADESGEPEVLVRRSDEDIALFDTHRIVEALVREAGIDADLAEQIGLEVREFIQKFGFRTLSSSLVRAPLNMSKCWSRISSR